MTVTYGQAYATFAEAYAAHYDPMIRLAFLTTDSLPAAEDIVQDAFTELYLRWPEVTDPAAWLRRVVVNKSISWLRRLLVARRHLSSAAPRAWHTPPTPDDVAVRNALLKLKPRHRAAVFMRFYLDMSEADIAAALGCRPGTVKSMLHRSLIVLRGSLHE